MVNVGDDHVLKADVEYALVASVALMILPCILMNSYIIWWDKNTKIYFYLWNVLKLILVVYLINICIFWQASISIVFNWIINLNLIIN